MKVANSGEGAPGKVPKRLKVRFGTEEQNSNFIPCPASFDIIALSSGVRPKRPVAGCPVSGGNVAFSRPQPLMILNGSFLIEAIAGPDLQRTLIVLISSSQSCWPNPESGHWCFPPGT